RLMFFSHQKLKPQKAQKAHKAQNEFEWPTSFLFLLCLMCFMCLLWLNYGSDDLTDAALQFAIVSDGGTHGDVRGVDGRDAECDQLCSVDQESRRNTFFKPVAAKIAYFLADQNEVACGAFVNTAFTRHNLRFHFRWRVVEFDRHKPLACRLL